MIERFFAVKSRLHIHAKILFHLPLAYIVRQPGGTNSQFKLLFVVAY